MFLGTAGLFVHPAAGDLRDQRHGGRVQAYLHGEHGPIKVEHGSKPWANLSRVGSKPSTHPLSKSGYNQSLKLRSNP